MWNDLLSSSRWPADALYSSLARAGAGWCGLIWTIVITAAGGLFSLLIIRDIVVEWVVMIPLLIWPLATRRRGRSITLHPDEKLLLLQEA